MEKKMENEMEAGVIWGLYITLGSSYILIIPLLQGGGSS